MENEETDHLEARLWNIIQIIGNNFIEKIKLKVQRGGQNLMAVIIYPRLVRENGLRRNGWVFGIAVAWIGGGGRGSLAQLLSRSSRRMLICRRGANCNCARFVLEQREKDLVFPVCHYTVRNVLLVGRRGISEWDFALMQTSVSWETRLSRSGIN